MSVPWVNGTVAAVAEQLRATRDSSPGNDGAIYASALGMLESLARDSRPYGEPGRSVEARMADIVTVLDALAVVEREGQL